METDLQNQIEIELPEDIALGNYSNLTIIGHSSSEFILDFITMLPGLPKAKVNTRIIMSPENAKRLMAALSENIKEHEVLYGDIEMRKLNNNNQNPKPAGEA